MKENFYHEIYKIRQGNLVKRLPWYKEKKRTTKPVREPFDIRESVTKNINKPFGTGVVEWDCLNFKQSR
jgi:hypothetical protein